MTETLEIVNFRLEPGTEAGFAAGNRLVSDWLARQPCAPSILPAST